MNELDHILDVHRREQRRFEFCLDVIIAVTVLVVCVIIRSCGR